MNAFTHSTITIQNNRLFLSQTKKQKNAKNIMFSRAVSRIALRVVKRRAAWSSKSLLRSPVRVAHTKVENTCIRRPHFSNNDLLCFRGFHSTQHRCCPVVDGHNADEAASLGKAEAMVHMWFTCSVCETRQQKSFSKVAYDEGIVIVRCKGCHNLHLIADNEGRLGDRTNIEALLAEKGESPERVNVDMDSFSFTPEDIDLFNQHQQARTKEKEEARKMLDEELRKREEK